MNLFQKNLTLLHQHDPSLARRVETEPFPDSVAVTASKDGHPIPRIGSVSLHSTYRPLEEGARWVSGFRECAGKIPVVYGLGFGYHIRQLLRKTSGELAVIEPWMPMFRAFLEVMDLSPFLPRTRFWVAEPVPKLMARCSPEGWEVLSHRPTVRLEAPYFERLNQGRKLVEDLEKHRLRVLVVHPIYGGSLPTAEYAARALKNLGHEVVSVECDRFAQGFFYLKNAAQEPQHCKILSERFMNLMGEVTAAQAAEFRPDLVLALAQAPLQKEVLQRLKALQVPLAFWFVEDFRSLPYWKDIAPAYDCVFTLQRGEFLDRLKSIGVSRSYYLPQGACLEIHRPLELTPEEHGRYAADLSFMGAPYYNRRQSFPRLLDFDFKVWGPGWDPQSSVGARVANKGEWVSPDEAVRIFNASRINLNLHSSTYHEGVNPDGDFVNPRTFEIAACSAFQLVDARSELGDLFHPGREIVPFQDIEDLRDKTRYYLDHPEARLEISRRSHRRVVREHTMEHRMKELLVAVFLDRRDDLVRRIENRADPLELMIEEAGETTELGRFLKDFRGVSDFSLQTVVDRIGQGEGDLSRNEILMLMLNQVIKQKEAPWPEIF